MILHFWALHPNLEDDWLEACAGWSSDYLHAPQDDGTVDVGDDSDGVDKVSCPSPSSDSPSTIIHDDSGDLCYSIPVHNRFTTNREHPSDGVKC